MLPQILFLMQLVLGYVACLLCFGVYILPRLKSMERMEAQRVIATVHSFRFFGLVFILPGVVAFNFVGTADILLDYYHAVRLGLPALAGQLGAAYVIPILYVPMLMITHFVALYWLVRPYRKTAPVLTYEITEP